MTLWASLCVAGAVFREIGLLVYAVRAVLVTLEGI